MHALSLERAWMAVENVRKRLLNSTAALNRAGVPYAVIGGNAVGAWVARVDVDAVRNTLDVDILLRREDIPRATAAFNEIGYDAAEARGTTVFVERESPSIRRGLHIFFSNERVRSFDAHGMPDTVASQTSNDGFRLVNFVPMLEMMLASNRLKDHVQLPDMLELDMITPEIDAALPDQLRARLDELHANPQ